MKIAIINYPYSLRSAVFGLREVFVLANELCKEQSIEPFGIDIIEISDLLSNNNTQYSVIFLPPSVNSKFYLTPSDTLLKWLRNRHHQGSMLCSACAGAFIIAATGLLQHKEITTHWNLANSFHEHYPLISVNPEKMLIHDGNIMTAGGMMAWLDLALEVIAQLRSPAIMRQLGKLLVVDTGQREQRYYQQFSPTLNHSDKVILTIQKTIHAQFHQVLKITELASLSHVTERTFLRRFIKATGIKPSEYIQRLRMQKACDLLENTVASFEVIANQVGYEDVSACRKAFVRIIGLTPRNFRQRFVKN
jgi:transcriptional regulator GlxA family with amidase domain